VRIELEIAFSFKRSLPPGYETQQLPEGVDVLETMRLLAERYPMLRERLFDEAGEIRRDINALINGGNVTLKQGFATSLRDGDRLTILPPMGGG